MEEGGEASLSCLGSPSCASVAQAAPEPSTWLSLHEEENLARDLHARLEAAYGLAPFANIGRSEERHIAAVAVLLEAKSLDIPAHTPGVYNDGSLQAVYDQLAAQGDASLVGALRAGALVEEIDIADLDELLAQDGLTNRERTVLSNLREASGHHLRAFVRNLEARGEPYTPAVLDDDTFAAFVEAPAGRADRSCQRSHERCDARGRPDVSRRVQPAPLPSVVHAQPHRHRSCAVPRGL